MNDFELLVQRLTSKLEGRIATIAWILDNEDFDLDDDWGHLPKLESRRSAFSDVLLDLRMICADFKGTE